MGTGFASSEVQRPDPEANHTSPSSAEVKNVRSYNSTPPYTCMAWCLAKQQGQFNFLPILKLSKYSRNELWTILVLCISRIQTRFISFSKLWFVLFSLKTRTHGHDAAGYQCSSPINYLQTQLFRTTLLIRCRYCVIWAATCWLNLDDAPCKGSFLCWQTCAVKFWPTNEELFLLFKPDMNQ